jgi:hypothetical protein
MGNNRVGIATAKQPAATAKKMRTIDLSRDD